jgi:hypothetical protein
MPRLLFNQEWFDSLSSEGQYETDFEGIVVSRAGILFPDYFAVSFKKAIHSDNDSRIPDFALIEKRYRNWWVVEIEMAHHSLHGHVLPQVQTFANGKYGTEHVEYLVAHSKEIDPVVVGDMVKGTQPRVLVVVNKTCADWVEPIRRHGGLLAVVEVFRSGRNQHVLRVNGEAPRSIAPQMVSTCRLDSLVPRLLQIDSPAALGVDAGGTLSITFGQGITDWQRVETQRSVWLNPLGRNPLTAKKTYMIMRDQNGLLLFQEA